MKKIIAILLLITVILGFSVPALAYNPTGSICTTGGTNSSVCSPQNKSPIAGKNGVLKDAIEILSVVTAIVSVFMMVIGGVTYVTSGGESQRTNSAKNTILYAMIGLVVVAISQVLVHFVIGHL